MNSENVDLMRDVLDHEIVDIDGVPCGMVDDLELEGDAGSPLAVVALRIGPGAWTDRLPWFFPRLARALVGHGQARIPWSEVALSVDRIQLKSSAKDLGLNAGDRKLEKWIKRLPRSEAD